MLPQTREALRKANLGNQHTKGNVLSTEHKEKYSKIKVEEVRYIKQNPKNLTTQQLADELGVSYNIVRNILIGHTWKEV